MWTYEDDHDVGGGAWDVAYDGVEVYKAYREENAELLARALNEHGVKPAGLVKRQDAAAPGPLPAPGTASS